MRRPEISSLLPPPSLSFGWLFSCLLSVPCKTSFSCEATDRVLESCGWPLWRSMTSWRRKKCFQPVHPIHPSLLDEQEVRLPLCPSRFSSPHPHPFSTHTEILAAPPPERLISTPRITRLTTNSAPLVHTPTSDSSIHATERTW